MSVSKMTRKDRHKHGAMPHVDSNGTRSGRLSLVDGVATRGLDRDGDEDEDIPNAFAENSQTKEEMEAVFWIYAAVAAVIGGAVLAFVIWRTRADNPWAMSHMIRLTQGVFSVANRAVMEAKET